MKNKRINRLMLSAILSMAVVPAFIITASGNENSKHISSQRLQEVKAPAQLIRPTVKASTRYALIVGIDHYSSPGNDLNTCVNDAVGMKDTVFLADPSGRWQSSNIYSLTDSDATKSNIRQHLSQLASTAGAGDLVVYFQSSHGGQVSGKDAVLSTYANYYYDSELGSDLTQFNSETTVIIILDACHSAGMFKGSGVAPEWPFAKRAMAAYREAKTAQLRSQGKNVPKTLGNNIAFMTACDYNEYSYCSSYYSLYAEYLIGGCSLSSVDSNSNNEYQFSELHEYAGTEAAQVQSQTAQSYNSSLLDQTIARAVESTTPPTPTPPPTISSVKNDYDGDGSSDIAIYNSASGYWHIRLSSSGTHYSVGFGGYGYTPVPADYDGDGITDFALYHEGTGCWHIYYSSSSILGSIEFGGYYYKPLPADYDGDGKADVTVYDEWYGYWYCLPSSTLTLSSTQFGGYAWYPVPADYDGDARADLAIYDIYWWSGYWYLLPTSTATLDGISFGDYGYQPIPADFDGDGTEDIAVYNWNYGYWYMLYSSDWHTYYIDHGGYGCTAVLGDYDGDGRTDITIYHEASGWWYFYLTGSGSYADLYFGGSGYTPIQ